MTITIKLWKKFSKNRKKVNHKNMFIGLTFVISYGFIQFLLPVL